MKKFDLFDLPGRHTFFIPVDSAFMVRKKYRYTYIPKYLSNIKIDSKKSVAMIDVFDSLNIGFGKETCRSRRHCGTCNTQQTGLHGTP